MPEVPPISRTRVVHRARCTIFCHHLHVSQRLHFYLTSGKPLYINTVPLSLNVAETHRRKGIAAALIAYAESEAIRLRFKSIHHEVGTTNDEAIQLYESLGYKHINKTVMNQWWVFPDGLNRRMTEEVSWVMTKILELPAV